MATQPVAGPDYKAIKNLSGETHFKQGDYLVVFGEVFNRGYVTGLIEAAEAIGMKVIYSTVGRRERDNTLRPLNQEELKEKAQPLINIPLEAGFDLEPASDGQSPTDQLKSVKLSSWEAATLNWEHIEESRKKGEQRFKNSVNEYLKELLPMIPQDANVLFAHTMAGGFPRAKVVMPAANRVFKGYGERYFSSQTFWNTGIGKLCDVSFKEVTGQTLQHLIDLTTDFRESRTETSVSYIAYGYHGTEVMVNGAFQWQSYSPYLQGWAKLHLEQVAKDASKKGINVSVYNCPEILTNSSSIFLGVEVSLYPLLEALDKVGKSSVVEKCSQLLKPEYSLQQVKTKTDTYLSSDTIQQWTEFPQWPQHNGPNQMKLMRESSAELIDMHKDNKHLITAELSEVVFKACGKVILDQAMSSKRKPVNWINHDIIADLA